MQLIMPLDLYMNLLLRNILKLKMNTTKQNATEVLKSYSMIIYLIQFIHCFVTQILFGTTVGTNIHLLNATSEYLKSKNT